MDMQSTGRIALVTGGSRGLGKEMALALAKNGVDVVLTYHSKEQEAAAVVKDIHALGARAAALQLDSSDTKGFIAFFDRLRTTLQEHFGATRFDHLVNNAGVGIFVPFAETTEEQFDALVNIHLKGVFFLTQQALPFLNDGGSIVNVATGLTRFSYPGYAAYASMKGGVEVLTRYLAKELGARGIRVNAIAPGAIETDFAGGTVRDNEHVNKHIASITALGRVGVPEDIGSVVAFLCDPASRWVNAQRLEASGGQQI